MCAGSWVSLRNLLASRRSRFTRSLAVLLLCLGVARLSGAQQVSYVYDGAGRLALVNYGNGTGIQYNYDSAGNLINKSFGAVPLPPRIDQLSPASGPAAAVVAIRGSALSPVLDVRFGAITAVVRSITVSEIDVQVPVGAVTGPVTVTTASGSAVSPGNFVVTLALSQTNLALRPGGAGKTATVGPYAAFGAGYAAATISSGGAPYGTAVFSYIQNGIVVSEVGVPVSPPTTSARIFVDYRPSVSVPGGAVSINTGFAAVNLGRGVANVNLTLRNAQGLTLAGGAIRLATNAHMAKFIDQLAPDFILPNAFSAVGFGSLEFTSDQPLSILALRMSMNQRGDVLYTSTPIADLTSPLAQLPLVFPQVADGGGYQMTLVFLNTSGGTETGSIRFAGNNGQALAMRLVGGSPAAVQFPYSIPSGGLLRLLTDGSPGSVTTGWALLTPDPGTAAPVGAGVFSFTQSGVLATESGVPSATPTTRALVYIDKSKGHDTGLAVVNAGTEALRLQTRALQTDGVSQVGSTGVLDLVPGGHDAEFAGQLIPEGLPDGFTGVLEISAGSPFAALTIRSLTNGRGDFLLTTFPIADATRPAPAPLIFPQIADGSGFQTQFVFINTGGTVSTLTIDFLGDGGGPLSVGQSAAAALNPVARQLPEK
jgi:YD repeat-containing protein